MFVDSSDKSGERRMKVSKLWEDIGEREWKLKAECGGVPNKSRKWQSLVRDHSARARIEKVWPQKGGALERAYKGSEEARQQSENVKFQTRGARNERRLMWSLDKAEHFFLRKLWILGMEG